MPPKITRVRWSAQNVPWGLSFNEKTGTFSGTPEDVGEYVVPVTVETNYGKDTKDVKIIVEPPTYTVYAIGAKAKTWSENAEPDEDGFYKLGMPKTYELVAHYNGFGALTAGRKYYCCGPYRPYMAIGEDGKTTSLKEAITPIYLYDQMSLAKSSTGDWSGAGSNFSLDERRILPKVDRIIYVYYLYNVNSGGTSTSRTGNVLIFWNSSLCEGLRYSTQAQQIVTIGTARTESWVAIPGNYGKVPVGVSQKNAKTALDDKSYLTGSICYLSEDNTKWVSVSSIGFDLGYTAIKPFDGTLFRALSENHYLDNNPDNFTHGIIKDAWEYGSVAYVQTTSNQLYEYVSSSKTWNLLGTYDVKKIEVPNANHLFLLTNDGKLYHKGKYAVTGLFDEPHDTLTPIFQTLSFVDFTFGGNTLTVLRE